jgi:hypothetical protein
MTRRPGPDLEENETRRDETRRRYEYMLDFIIDRLDRLDSEVDIEIILTIQSKANVDM